MRSFAEDTGRYVPVVGGKRTRSLILFNNGYLMGSMWNPAVIAKRSNMTIDEILSKSMLVDDDVDPDVYSDDDEDDDLLEEEDDGDVEDDDD